MDTAGGDVDEGFAIIGRTEAGLLRGDEGIEDAALGKKELGLGGEGFGPGGGVDGGLLVVFFGEFVFAAKVVGPGDEEEEEGILVVGDEGVVAGGDGGGRV